MGVAQVIYQKMPRKKGSGIANKLFKDPRYPLAKFIINKFVDKREINWFRDLTTCYKLLRKYPEEYFWKYNLPCDFKIKNLSIFLFEKGADKLKMYYIMYKKALAIDKKIAVKKNKEYPLEDTVETPKEKKAAKPKNIYEFCK